MPDDLAVFISSSDNTSDIFAQVYPSIKQFWGDCPFPIYIGMNSQEIWNKSTQKSSASGPGLCPVFARKIGWRQELLDQIEQIKEEQVLLLLDDFLFLAPVDTATVQFLLGEFKRKQLKYLRLIRRSRAALPALVAVIINDTRIWEELPEGFPYYSSLQATIWNRSHLLAMLALEGNIWEFEHQSIKGTPHHAICQAPPIKYNHVVEKGKWMAGLDKRFLKLGLSFQPGSRQSHSTGSRINEMSKRIKFMILGYSVVRLKRRLKALGVRLQGKKSSP